VGVKPPTPIPRPNSNPKGFSQNEHAMWLSMKILTCLTSRLMLEYFPKATKHQHSLLVKDVFSLTPVSLGSRFVSHTGYTTIVSLQST
jgi:hypothetical protein